MRRQYTRSLPPLLFGQLGISLLVSTIVVAADGQHHHHLRSAYVADELSGQAARAGRSGQRPVETVTRLLGYTRGLVTSRPRSSVSGQNRHVRRHADRRAWRPELKCGVGVVVGATWRSPASVRRSWAYRNQFVINGPLPGKAISPGAPAPRSCRGTPHGLDIWLRRCRRTGHREQSMSNSTRGGNCGDAIMVANQLPATAQLCYLDINITYYSRPTTARAASRSNEGVTAASHHRHRYQRGGSDSHLHPPLNVSSSNFSLVLYRQQHVAGQGTDQRPGMSACAKPGETGRRLRLTLLRTLPIHAAIPRDVSGYDLRGRRQLRMASVPEGDDLPTHEDPNLRHRFQYVSRLRSIPCERGRCCRHAEWHRAVERRLLLTCVVPRLSADYCGHSQLGQLLWP